MELRFDLNLDTASLQRQLQSEIDKSTKEISSSWMRKNFQQPGWYGYEPGEQYLKIKYTLESMAGNENTQKIINEIIEAKWDEALRNATEEAIIREAMKVATKELKKQKAIPQYKGR